MMFKDGHGLLGLAGSVKSVVSEELINEMSRFFAC